MIFKQPMIDAILARRKTVTRRPVDSLWGDDAQPCRYREGRTYAIQPGRGKPGVGRIEILDVELQPLSDALAEYGEEGFTTRDAFIAYWRELYGTFDEDLAVWRIEFALVPEAEAA